jgi:hypothetical protein
MPDITMCNKATCDKKDLCYRYMAIPNKYQSYSCFTVCEAPDYEMFYPIGSKRTRLMKGGDNIT